MINPFTEKEFEENYIKWQKKFVDGDQQLAFNVFTGEEFRLERQFYWQDCKSYNIIKSIVDSWKNNYIEEYIWGKGKAVDQLIDYQKQYNAYMNQISSMVRKLDAPILMVEDGSVDIDELCEEGLAPGKVLIYRQGTQFLPTTLQSVSKENIEIIYTLSRNLKLELNELANRLEINLKAYARKDQIAAGE